MLWKLAIGSMLEKMPVRCLFVVVSVVVSVVESVVACSSFVCAVSGLAYSGLIIAFAAFEVD